MKDNEPTNEEEVNIDFSAKTSEFNYVDFLNAIRTENAEAHDAVIEIVDSLTKEVKSIFEDGVFVLNNGIEIEGLRGINPKLFKAIKSFLPSKRGDAINLGYISLKIFDLKQVAKQISSRLADYDGEDNNFSSQLEKIATLYSQEIQERQASLKLFIIPKFSDMKDSLQVYTSKIKRNTNKNSSITSMLQGKVENRFKEKNLKIIDKNGHSFNKKIAKHILLKVINELQSDITRES